MLTSENGKPTTASRNVYNFIHVAMEMSFKKCLEDATTHFLRSQFTDCFTLLQEMKKSTKKSIVLQSIILNNCKICAQQLESSPTLKSFEDILHTLKGVSPTRVQSIVQSIVHYNRLITLLESPPIQLEAKAASVVLSIQKYLTEVRQCLDESSVPVTLLKCALTLSQQLAGLNVTDWTIPADKQSKESWCIVMMIPTGCKILTSLHNTRHVNETYDELPLEGVQALLRCQQACQAGSWQQAVKIIKHNKKLWKGSLKNKMNYIKNFCLYNLSSFDEAKQSQQELLLRSNLTPSLKVKGHQLLGCCFAQQGKFQLAITEFKKALADVNQVSPLLSLFNLSLLFLEVGRTDTEVEILSHLINASSEIHPTLLQDSCLNFSPGSNIYISTTDLQIKAMYVYAHRCLQLERLEEAAGTFLDLIGHLEDVSVTRLGYSSLLPVVTPTISHLYLEASFALLGVNKFEEAEAICDILLSRSEHCKVTSRGLFLDSSTAKTETRNSTEGEECKVSTPGGFNEGQEDNSTEMVTDVRLDPQTVRDRSLTETLCLASAHLIKSECLMKMRNPSGSLESLDKALHILHECSFKEKEEDVAYSSGPVTKRRRLEPNQRESKNSQDIDRLKQDVRLLKGRAYNNKSFILIGQGNLHEALPVLLSSLECCPENADARKNYCLLLFKMGQKKQAYMEWRKYQNSSP
ncbi:uncharacterized protein [Apostichopus japonicus]|uniref:uncharacterized protein isoform X2 n=1 Tax=Stichopus japonicus TaxID=307972 RepID=UPI003AB35C46